MDSFYVKVRDLLIPENPEADETIDQKEPKPDPDQLSLIDQKNSETNRLDLECQYCFDVFAAPEDLISHKRILHHGPKRYTCKWCNITFSYVGWRYHYLKHTNDARYSCTSCNKKFLLLQQLESHLAHHKYFCSLCNDSFVTMKQITAHRKSAHNIGPEIHPLVPKRSKNKFKAHRNRNLSEDEKSFSSETESSLRPRRNSNVEKSYDCGKCHAKFSKQFLLRDHIKKHRNCWPYWCNDCGSRFIQKKILEKHVRKHLLKCSTCSKSFPNKYYLDVHIYNEHMQSLELEIKTELKVPCQYCNLTFTSEEELRNHINITGENFIICARCINMFENEYEFELHLRTEHNLVR